MRTLIFDRDKEFADSLRNRARSSGWEIEAFESVEAALSRLGRGGIDLISLAADGGSARTHDLVSRFCEAAPDTPVVVLGAGSSTAERLATARAGAVLHLPDRPDPERLLRGFARALDQATPLGRPILILDRDEELREILRERLAPLGHEVCGLSSGAGLFDKLEELEPGVALLSRNLPGSGPLPLIRAVRASERWTGLGLFILIGRRDRPFEREAYLAGADQVLLKDTPDEELRSRVAGLLARREASTARADGGDAAGWEMPAARPAASAWRGEPRESASAAEAGVPASRGKPAISDSEAATADAPDVVIVQDDPLFLEMLEYMLSNQGFDVLAFSDGWEACEWLSAAEVGARRPVVLLEPDMAGLQGLRVVQERGRYGRDDLQFVILSVDGGEAAQILGFKSGAVDYIVKPVRLPVVQARVRSLLEGR